MSYGDTVKDNMPEAADGDNYTVTKDDVSIELTTKSYTITTEDAKKVAAAVVEKGKNDGTLKDFMGQVGVSDSDYDSMWDELNLDDADEESITLDLYYKGDDIAGFKATNSDGEALHMIVASDETHVIVDCDMSSVDDSTFLMSGLVTYTDDTLNGSINTNFDSDGSKMDMTISYNDLKITDDSAKGTITASASQDGESMMDMTVAIDISGNTGSISYGGNVEGQDIGTLTVKVEETNASDITVPTGTMYNFTNEEDLQKYSETCDIEGWQSKLKDALGDELYSSLFGSSYSSSYDYDMDTDSYDFSQYDFEESTSSTATGTTA